MPSLIDALTGFNRRERQILVGWVLDRATFPLGHEFKDRLTALLGIPVPPDSFVAMDYNLNWLCGALLWSQGNVGLEMAQKDDSHDGIDLNDNSDSDILIAFALGPKTHVVLLEAKGYTGWDGSQIKKKSARLQLIFGTNAMRFPDVVPHWVFVSPKRLTNKSVIETMVPWMLVGEENSPLHLPLPQPASHKFAIARTDADGNAAAKGHWKIRTDKWPGAK